MKIVGYEYASAINMSNLKKNTESCFKYGWQPLGAPFLWDDHLIQTLVKYADDSHSEIKSEPKDNDMASELEAYKDAYRYALKFMNSIDSHPTSCGLRMIVKGYIDK